MLKKIFLLAFTICILTSFNGAFAQKKEAKAAMVENMIESKSFTFDPQTVLPLGFAARQLTPGYYSVKLTPEVLTVDLPFFGRAYTADFGSSQGGFHFISKDFTTEVVKRKKGNYDVVIKPRDLKDVNYLTFSISQGGYASLQVSSNSRQGISFSGIIEESKSVK
ncbi:MAG: hypothetical protein JWN76_1888 [Chitinophagaceae bacterium]|nr:hypothetical protein [Chitinophagaceae bacterium]